MARRHTSNGHKSRTVTVAQLAIVVGCLLVPPKGSAEKISSTSSAVQALTFADRSGVQHTIAELRGRPAVVNFWATWCGPCKEEMPRLQKLAEQYAAKEVRFVAISLDAPEARSKIDETVKRRGLRIPVWTGGTERTLSDLQLGELVPATMILDEEGAVIGKIEGEIREKDVQARVDWLLGGRQGKQPKVIQKNDW